MAARSSATQLARLLNSLSAPVYLLDDQRRIAFLNDACGAWLAKDPQTVLGEVCNYHSESGSSEGEGLAAALCPPPQVFNGQRATALVAATASDGRLVCRRAEFIPLAGPKGTVAVIAILETEDIAPDSVPASIQYDPAPADLHERVRRFRQELKSRYLADSLVGESPAMQRIRAQAALAAAARANVLVVGAPGSGRKHLARSIHYAQAAETSAALVPLSCGLLSEELLRSALLGLPRQGAGVTLLLGDVDRLAAEAQPELVKFLAGLSPKLRLLSTAEQPLVELASRGAFHAELAYSLSTLMIELPALNERREDIPLLAQTFLEEQNAQGGKQVGGFTAEALDRLSAYAWPRNIAELVQTVRQAYEKAEGHEVAARDLPDQIALAADAERRARRPAERIVLEEFLARVESELLRRALKRAKGNKSKAAQLLGMTRPRLYRRMVQLGLAKPPRRRE